MACSKIHGPDDPCLGEPLCLECFDYLGAVIWNNGLGELWRRTMIYLPRRLAKLTQITQKRLHELVRVSYAKVSEYQRRGLVHLHPVIRLDRRMPTYRNRELRAPDRRFTSELLEQALRDAVKAVSVKVPDQLGGRGEIRCGKQLDVQPTHGRRGSARPARELSGEVLHQEHRAGRRPAAPHQRR